MRSVGARVRPLTGLAASSTYIGEVALPIYPDGICRKDILGMFILERAGVEAMKPVAPSERERL